MVYWRKSEEETTAGDRKGENETVEKSTRERENERERERETEKEQEMEWGREMRADKRK